jgi:fimbrial isopeptide formation D2 family protein/LPXTG-motif cell wall-anchored protein
MVFAMVIPAMATSSEPTSEPATGGTITITPPTGVDANATNTYSIYKVFDAVGNGNDKISYTVMSGKTGVPDVAAQYPSGEYDAATCNHFIVDTAGNVHYGTESNGTITDASTSSLDSYTIAAIAAYVAGDSPVTTATSTGSANATATGLNDGYYYITTTTGTVVTIDSTNHDAAVNDKNSVPSVDKTITGASSIDADGKKALAQVGTTVNYSAEITVGTGAKGYVFHDTMETGLSYNNDVTVSVGGTAVPATSGEAPNVVTNYTVGKVGDDTFTVTFDDAYIKTLAADTVITVAYSATVTEDAITTDPLNNTCYVSYGDSNSNNKTPTSEADVYEAKFTVTKQDGEGAPLADAGFVIKNAAGKYYKFTAGHAAVEDDINTPEVETAPATTDTVEWVDSIDDATEYFSNAQGAVQPFTGLANGTYTLVEKTVPSGYNKAADSTFTVAEHNYEASNLEQSATVVNNSGSELPSTGGIGTTIFTIVGIVLILGAGIALVARRRMSAAK